MAIRIAACLTLGLSVASCGNPQRDKLDRGMTFARRQFVAASRDLLAATSLGSIAETGGNLSTYVYANMPDRADLPRYQDNVPSGPWSIVLRPFGDDRVIIEGFGDSLNRPLVAETASVRFGPRRVP